MNEIGIVLYKKSSELGTLDAKWSVTSNKNGTGKAVGGPSEGYSGKYQIRYFHDDGSFDADLELEICKREKDYEVVWIKNGVVRAKGIGMEVNDTLAVAWQSIS